MSDTESQYDSHSESESESESKSEIIENIEEYENDQESESMSESESEIEEEKEIHTIINERTKELLKLRKEKIEQIFCPLTERERKCLYSIAQEVDFIDIKPYSHNIIGLNLRILSDDEGYYDSKLKEVVKMFKLDKKGWGHLI